VASPDPVRTATGGATPPSTSVSVRLEDGAGVVRVVLAGEIDAESEATLTQVGDHALARRLPIEVDSRAVSFMDSTGVSFLALLASRSARPVTLVDPPEIVRFLVDTTGIAPMVRISPPETSG
jgi:anti-anti-sigma factor